MFNVEEFNQRGILFFEALANELTSLGFDLATVRADHLCFRVATGGEYSDYKAFLAGAASLLAETPVNGRAICTFRLHRPLVTARGIIDVVELPAPKPGSPYATGFEHAEFVIDESFTDLAARHPALEFKFAPPKMLNDELGLSTRAGQAKFHHLDLARVVEIEDASMRDIVWLVPGEGVPADVGGRRIHRTLETASPHCLLVTDDPAELRRAKSRAGCVRGAALWRTSYGREEMREAGGELFFATPEILHAYLGSK